MASSPEGAFFYPPIIADPNPGAAGSIFQGSFSVWRTQDWGGDRDFLEANCPEFTTSSRQPGCGNFVRIGPADALEPGCVGRRAMGHDRRRRRGRLDRPGSAGRRHAVGGDRRRPRVHHGERQRSGRVASSGTRLDPLATNDPNRAISEISVDPTNGRHAWISYNGYNVNSPAD